MREVIKQAIETYGKDMQLNVAIEEFSELIKEICKSKRGYDNIPAIIEEMADCYIMLEQLKLIYRLGSTVIEDAMIVKTKRLKDRLAKHTNEKFCTGKRCPMQVGYDVVNCKDKECMYRTETEKGGVEE